VVILLKSSITEPITEDKAHIIFDLHGVLVSKKQMAKKYDHYMLEFLQKNYLIEIEPTKKMIVEANKKWLIFWKEAIQYNEQEILEKYEKANERWIQDCLQGHEFYNYQQLAAFLEYHVPTNFCCLFPEVRDELVIIRRKKISCSVASSATTRHIIGILTGCQLLNYFSYLVGLDNTLQLKSKLDYYKKLFEIIHTTPENCIFVGNSLHEILLPQKLGAKVISITREENYHTVKTKEILDKADLVLSSLNDFYNELKSNNLII
jgi:phosphoglycolate phosphatase-like HAD superfamily hydrolase